MIGEKCTADFTANGVLVHTPRGLTIPPCPQLHQIQHRLATMASKHADVMGVAKPEAAKVFSISWPWTLNPKPCKGCACANPTSPDVLTSQPPRTTTATPRTGRRRPRRRLLLLLLLRLLLPPPHNRRICRLFADTSKIQAPSNS